MIRNRVFEESEEEQIDIHDVKVRCKIIINGLNGLFMII